MAEDKPQSGILTEKQRQKIEGKTSNAGVRMAHKRARDRLYAGITADGPLLFEALSDGTLDPQEVIKAGTDPHGIGTPELANGLRETASILYLLAEAAKLKPESVIEDGMSQAKQRINQSKIEALFDTYKKSPGDLTLKDLNLLIEKGKINKQDRNKAFDRIDQ